MAYLQMKVKADSLVQGLAEVQRQYGTGYLSAFGEGLIDRNNYYTFDYGKHKEVEYNSLKDFRQTSPLHFESTDGTRLEPLYNLHHCRYAVYLRKKQQLKNEI